MGKLFEFKRDRGRRHMTFDERKEGPELFRDNVELMQWWLENVWQPMKPIIWQYFMRSRKVTHETDKR